MDLRSGSERRPTSLFNVTTAIVSATALYCEKSVTCSKRQMLCCFFMYWAITRRLTNREEVHSRMRKVCGQPSYLPRNGLSSTFWGLSWPHCSPFFITRIAMEEKDTIFYIAVCTKKIKKKSMVMFDMVLRNHNFWPFWPRGLKMANHICLSFSSEVHEILHRDSNLQSIKYAHHEGFCTRSPTWTLMHVLWLYFETCFSQSIARACC